MHLSLLILQEMSGDPEYLSREGVLNLFLIYLHTET